LLIHKLVVHNKDNAEHPLVLQDIISMVLHVLVLDHLTQEEIGEETGEEFIHPQPHKSQHLFALLDLLYKDNSVLVMEEQILEEIHQLDLAQVDISLME
jgi:hypothetical protein